MRLLPLVPTLRPLQRPDWKAVEPELVAFVRRREIPAPQLRVFKGCVALYLASRLVSWWYLLVGSYGGVS